MRKEPTQLTNHRCPKCGKLALDVRYYEDGSQAYNHEMYVGPLGMIEVTEHCFIGAEKGEGVSS